VRPHKKEGEVANILIADDIDEVLFAYETILCAAGHTVRTVHSGNEACNIINEESFDLILTDLMMPDGDGISIASHVRNMEDRPKVMVITGGGDCISPYEALKVGEFLFDESMVKPVKTEELLAAIDRVLKKVN